MVLARDIDGQFDYSVVDIMSRVISKYIQTKPGCSSAEILAFVLEKVRRLSLLQHMIAFMPSTDQRSWQKLQQAFSSRSMLQHSKPACILANAAGLPCQILSSHPGKHYL